MTNHTAENAARPSAQEEAQEQLRLFEKRYRRLFESARDGILLLDAATHQITDANPFSVELLGHCRDELRGKSLWEIGLFSDEESAAAVFQELEKTGSFCNSNLRFQTRDGQQKEVEFSCEIYPGKVGSLVECIIRDNGAPVAEKTVADSPDIFDQSTRNPQKMKDAAGELAPPSHAEQKARNIERNSAAAQREEAKSQEIISIWESMTDAFFNLDTEWRFTHVNPRAAQIWQENAADLVGKNIWEEFPAAVGLKFYDKYHRAMKQQVAVSFEEFFPPHNAWREIHAYPSPQGLSVYFRDITQRKDAEAQLSYQKTLLEAQMESSPDGIFVVSGQKKILSFNRRFVQMWNIPEDVATSGDDAAIREVVLEQVVNRQEVSENAAHLYENPAEKVHDEITLHNGSVFDRHSVPISSGDGSFDGRIWYFRDVTQNKQAEKTLRASQQQFQSIVTHVPGMVYQFVLRADGSTDFPFVSEGSLELLELTSGEVQRNPAALLALIRPADRDGFANSMALSASQLSPWVWEGQFKTASGKIKWVQGASRPRRLPDGGTLWDALLIDVTQRKEAEQERDRFLTMSIDMLGIAGMDGYLKRLNPAFSEILGYSDAELLAVPFLDFVHPEDVAATREAMKTLAQGHLVVGLENRCRSKNGAWRWLEWKCAPILDQGLAYAAARDITERKESEILLREMHNQLELRVEERTADLAQSNAALQLQIGEREEAEAETRARARQQEAVTELGRRALTDIDIDTLLRGATALVSATLDVEFSGIMEVMPGGDTLRFRANSDSPTDLPAHTVPAGNRSQAGYVLQSKVPTIVHDLATETRFEPSQALLKKGVVSSIAVIVGGYDQPFGTLAAHTTRQRLFSQDDVNFLESMANVLAAAIERHRIETEIRQLNAQLENTNEQLRIENLDRQMAMGALREVVEILEQATKEADKARESAEIANSAKSEFLSRMSHELRTPLNAILGFGQILNNESLSTLQQESVGYILKGGHHLLDLINEVLDIASVEAGRNGLSIEPVALDDIVPEACTFVRPLAAERNIRLDWDLSDVGRSHVLADRQRLKQVLINLLSNAIKYNREEGQVRVLCRLMPDQQIRIAVTDEGMGIREEDFDKIFVPFERLKAANSGIEGTGLGLALSQRLVAALGGTLEVESVVGQGSTFFVQLARATAPQEGLNASMLQRFETQTGKPANRQCSVLCIEDNSSNLRLIELVLASRPEVVMLSAMQGSAGLNLARLHEPDVILLDLHLPDMSGQDVLTRLRQSAITRDIPVIVISADATPPQIEKVMNLGALTYLTKPLNVAEFLGILDEVLEAKNFAETTSPVVFSEAIAQPEEIESQ